MNLIAVENVSSVQSIALLMNIVLLKIFEVSTIEAFVLQIFSRTFAF